MKNVSRIEFMSLIEALTKITADITSYNFKKMVEIITSIGKICYDNFGQMEVDFADFDSFSIFKLKELSREVLN